MNEDDIATVEIGFTLHREEQGKGYAREAIQALIHLLFGREDITKVIGITNSPNHSSINLLTRSGMNLVSSKEVVFKNELCVEQTPNTPEFPW